ncbi:hypothetical protein Tco_0854395 [Tanacetum coccineum]
MASMNTRLNIEKPNGNIVQKHGGSKQVGFKQLGPSVETGVHGVHDEKRVWFEVESQGAQGDCEAEVFQSGLSKVFWAEDTTRSIYLVNRSLSSAIEFKKPIDMLGFFGWLASIKRGMLEPVKVRNIGFNESGEYKKTFIGSGVGMLDKFDRGLQIDVQVLWIMTTSWVDQSQEAAKEAIWLKGLAIESGFELKIVAGIATGALSKVVPRSRFQHRLKLLRIEDF